MKRYEELTETEKRALTNTEINEFVKIECMIAGIKLELQPIEPVKNIPAPSNTAFGVCEYYFKDLATAIEVAEFIQARMPLRSNYHNYYSGSSLQYLTPIDEIRTTTSKFYTKEECEQLNQSAKNYETAKRQYEKVLNEWQTENKKRQDIQTSIIDDWEEIIDKYRLLDNHVAQFKIYLDKAGDLQKAIDFYRLAYTINEETELYIRNAYKN